MVKLVVEARTKEERIQRRQKLGALHTLVVKPTTEKRYDHAFILFLTYLRNERLSLAPTKEGVDQQVSEYLEHLWLEGESQYLAGDTISAIQHKQPSLKKALPQSWRLLRTWQKHEIPCRAPPFTLQTLEVILGYLSKRDVTFAIALLLCFHACLRTSELLRLQAKHIVLGRHNSSMVLLLGPTKTSVHNEAGASAFG